MQRRAWLALAIVVSVAYLFLHQPVQLWVQALRSHLGGTLFSAVFLALAITFVATLGLIASRNSTAFRDAERNAPTEGQRTEQLADSRHHRLLPLGLWATTLCAAVVCYWLLVAVESELVHLPQFTLLFLLFFAWSRRPGRAAAWTGLAGLMDEVYQYWVLQAHWNVYLDWNDVVLNLIAAAFGICLVTSLGSWSPRRWSWRALSHGATWLLVFLGAALISAVGSGFMGVYRSTSPEAWRVLSRSDAPQAFWTFAEWSRKDFHILSPVQGFGSSLVLFVTLVAVDGWLRPTDQRQTLQTPNAPEDAC